MKYTYKLLPWFTLGAFLLAGCATSPFPSSPIAPLTTTNTPLEVPAVSATISKVPETALATPSLVPTLTPPVTLEPEKAADEINRLISEVPDCQSPCFWGIVPGQTTQGEAFNFFRRLGFPMTSSANSKIYSSTPGFDNLWTSVQLFIQDQVVNSIWARLDLGNYDGPRTPRPWSAFSPETMLLQYGKPSRVEFALYYPSEPGDSAGNIRYEMIMWFNEKEVVVDYFDGETKAGSVVRACPLTDRFGSVDLWIGKNPNAPSPHKVSLENATSLTIDQFYELMTQKDGRKCLDLKSEAFAEK